MIKKPRGGPYTINDFAKDFITTKSLSEFYVLCYGKDQNWFIWHSPCESRVHLNSRKIFLKYTFCTMWVVLLPQIDRSILYESSKTDRVKSIYKCMKLRSTWWITTFVIRIYSINICISIALYITAWNMWYTNTTAHIVQNCFGIKVNQKTTIKFLINSSENLSDILHKFLWFPDNSLLDFW